VFHHHPAATSKLALCYVFYLLHVCRRDKALVANPRPPSVAVVCLFAISTPAFRCCSTVNLDAVCQ
jgi:hypothetical protein